MHNTKHRLGFSKEIYHTVTIEQEGILNESELQHVAYLAINNADHESYFGDQECKMEIVRLLEEEEDEHMAELVKKHVKSVICEYPEMPDQSLLEFSNIERLPDVEL